MNIWLGLASTISVIGIIGLVIANKHQMKLFEAFHHCKLTDPTFEEKRDKYFKFSNRLIVVELTHMIFVILTVGSLLKWGPV